MKYILIALLIFVSYTNAQAQTQGSHQNDQKPNIVLIIADQFREDACKREGFELDTTRQPCPKWDLVR